MVEMADIRDKFKNSMAHAGASDPVMMSLIFV